MRGKLIVVFDPFRKLSDSVCCIRYFSHIHIVAFNGPHKGFSHSIAFRATNWCKTISYADVLRQIKSVFCYEARSIVCK